MKISMLIAALIVAATPARAEVVDIASDTELRVGYCLGVAEAFQGHTIWDEVVLGLPKENPLRAADREFKRQIHDRIERLRGYLRARGLSVGSFCGDGDRGSRCEKAW
jgi:hypothetical protein